MRRRWPALVAFVLLLAAGIITWVSAPDADAAGPDWHDDEEAGHAVMVDRLTKVREPVRVVESGLGVLPREAGDGDVLFLFPTNRPASAAEVTRVVDFVEAGGLLVVAADGQHVTQWAERLGHRFRGLPALLPPGSAVACVTANVTVDGAVYNPCFPSPTVFPPLQNPVLEQEAVFDFVAKASEPVWIDLDEDGRMDADASEAPARYPMAVGWQRGEGNVIALADADLFRNQALRDEPENELFLQALARSVPGDIYVDVSGGPRGPIERYMMPAYHAASAPGLLEGIALGLVLVGTLAGILAIPYATGWSRHAPNLDGDPQVEENALQLIQQSTRGRQPASPAQTDPAGASAPAGTAKDE